MRRNAISVILLALFLFAFSFGCERGCAAIPFFKKMKAAKAEEWVSKGEEIIKEDNPSEENLKKAIEYFNRAIEIYPVSVKAYLMRGLAYSLLNDFERAMSDCDFVITNFPNDYHVYYYRGITFFNYEMYEKAIDDFDKFIQFIERPGTDPDEVSYALDVYEYSVYAHEVLGEHEKALLDFSKAIEIEPGNDLLYFTRGLVYRIMGNNEEAVADFTRAIEVNADVGEYYFERAVSLLNLKRFDEALADLDRALLLDGNYSNDSLFYCHRGSNYFKLGNYDAAIENFTKAISLNPNDSRLYFSRGLAYSKLGNIEETFRDFTVACAMGEIGACINLEWMLQQIK